ncbi:MAG: ABC transporter permease [Thermoanaerobaculia bacterium]
MPLILKNLLRKKIRTFLTIGSILFPLLVIAFLGTFLRALNLTDPAKSGYFRVVTRHKVGLMTPIPQAWVRQIEPLRGVEAATVLAQFRGIYRDESAGNIFPRFATDASTFLRVFDDAVIVQGSAEAWKKDRASALVGERLIRKYGWRLGDRIRIRGTLYPVDLDLGIAAVYRLPYETSGSVFFHREYLEEAWPPVRGQVTTIWVRAQDNAAEARLPAEIDVLFENSPFPTKSDSESAFLTGFVQLLGNVRLLFVSLGAVLVLVIVLVAANTMAMSTRERVVEIAVMRTLGYTRGKVVSLILAESLLMALAGAAIGLALFSAGFATMRNRLIETRLSQFAAGMKIFPEVLAFAVGTAVLIGLLAALVPALRAAQRKIVDGLRFTG